MDVSNGWGFSEKSFWLLFVKRKIVNSIVLFVITGASMKPYLWKLSTILSWPRRSFFVRWSNMRASTRHSMNVLLYCGKPKDGSHSLPIHSWFISPKANVWKGITFDHQSYIYTILTPAFLILLTAAIIFTIKVICISRSILVDKSVYFYIF